MTRMASFGSMKQSGMTPRTVRRAPDGTGLVESRARVRVPLPAGGRSGPAARGVDPPHVAPAAGRGADRRAVVHGLGRRGGPAVRGQAVAARSVAARRRAFRGVGRRGWGARPPGTSRPPARSPACATSRARGCTAPRCRAPSSRARSRTPCSPAGSRPAAAAPRWPAGAGWSATTGAPSTPSAGSGCTPSGFAEAPGAWLDVAIGRVRVGRAVTPWVANGALSLDGARLRARRHRPRAVDARGRAAGRAAGGRSAARA